MSQDENWRDVEIGEDSSALNGSDLVIFDADAGESIDLGKKRARCLHFWLPIFLGGVLVLLFALAAVIYFGFGWTLDGDCWGCKKAGTE